MQGSLTPLANWWEVHPSKLGEPLWWKRWLKLGSPPIQGLHNCTDSHLSPSALWWVEEARLLPPQTEGHQIPMGTPLQGSPRATSIDAGTTEGVGRRSGWHLQDWICLTHIFKLTNPGVEVMYTLWQFNVHAFLEQYDEASMHPHIFASLHGYPGKWAHMQDEGKDIFMQNLLMHMEKTFGNKCDYNVMIRTLYEVQQKEYETVEEYMLCIHDAVAVIRRMYLEHLSDRERVLKKDRFYYGLHPYLHDALSFAMAEQPEREQAHPTFDTLYTLTKKLEAGQPAHTCRYTPSSNVYKEKHRCYPALVGRVAALEKEGLVSTDPVSGEDSRV